MELKLPPFVMKIVQGLHSAGYEAYIVGGAPRDLCLNRPVADWDVATSASPEAIRDIFSGNRHFSLKHGTVTLVQEDALYEVTTFRGPGGLGRSLKEDLGCRDFSINAMAYDVDSKELIDPYGGREDAARRTIRTVGHAQERFSEDPLRLMRAVRIATQLGFRIEPKTIEALASMADRLGSAATERIREELLKILLCERPSRGFNMMLRTGLLKVFLPELMEGYLKRQNRYHRYTIYKHIMETVDRVDPEPVLRLTALFHDIAKPRCREKVDGRWLFLGHSEASARLAAEIMGRLKFGKEITTRVTHLIAHHIIGYHTRWSDGAVRRFIRRVGLDNTEYLIAFRRADLEAHGTGEENAHLLAALEERIAGLVQRALTEKPRDLAIDGKKVMEVLGISPGPEVGRALEKLLDAVTDHPERNTEAGLVEMLKGMQRG